VRTRDAFRGRRSRVVLTPRRRRQVLRSFAGPTGRGQSLNPRDDGDKRARSPGRARSKPLKPLRAGMPGYSGGPVVTTLVCFILFRTRGCGCIGRPAFPTPSQGEGSIHYSGASRRGIAKLRLLFEKLNRKFADGRCRRFCSLPPCGGGLGRGVAASGLPVWGKPELGGRGSSPLLLEHRCFTSDGCFAEFNHRARVRTTCWLTPPHATGGIS
jgi:hypothetical protein